MISQNRYNCEIRDTRIRDPCGCVRIKSSHKRSRGFVSDVRSALANSELNHVLNKYGVPAVLTHGVGWFTCMAVVLFSLNSGLDMNVLLSHLPDSFKVLVDHYARCV